MKTSKPSKSSKPWIKAKTFRFFNKIHKWAGLAACLWLFVLGVTGIILDHHEWRWVNQAWVPQSWSSDRMNKVIWPGTPMRYVAVNEEDPNQWVGGSERGLWSTVDHGETWTAIPFDGLGKTMPQIYGILGSETGRLDNLTLATDDGIWALKSKDGPANRLTLKGRHVTSLSYGATPGSFVGVEDKSYIFRYDAAAGGLEKLKIKANVKGLDAPERFYRVLMDIHFGNGLLPGNWSLIMNDIGGFALAVLSLSGFLYWLMPKIWRRRKTPRAKQKFWNKWLYRSHGPIVGLVCLIPITIVSVSALPMNHIFGMIKKTENVMVERSQLPPTYQAKSLKHEITGIVTWPDDNEKLSIGTRFGILHTFDDGKSWTVDKSVPVERGAAYANFFGIGAYAFAGMSGNNYVIDMASENPTWQKMEGVRRAITGATIAGDSLYVKNSRAILKGMVPNPGQAFEETGVRFHHVAPGTPIFIFVADVHSGAVFPPQFKWVNDFLVLMALLLVLSGPIIWSWKRWK